jgi:predicted RNA binding protein YcfA (HicA-like mRNA interferase family)
MVTAQRGSHIKLRRLGPTDERQNLLVPHHRELDTGTCRAVLRQASRDIAIDQLAPQFYAEELSDGVVPLFKATDAFRPARR